MKKTNKILISIVIAIILAVVLFFAIKHIRGNNISPVLNKIFSNQLYKKPYIPDGFKKVETDTASWAEKNGIIKGWNDGLVIEDNKGNQFVWVPCTIKQIEGVTQLSRSNYEPYKPKFIPIEGDRNICEDGNILYEDLDPSNIEIKKSVKKYCGFYIARFETGIENGQLAERNSNNEQVSNNESTKNLKWVNGSPVSKKGACLYNYISTNEAEKISKTMYNTKVFHSALETSYCFDTVLKWIDAKAPKFSLNACDYGNYTINNEDKQFCGTDDKCKIKNIYDFAGNAAELTKETGTRLSYNDTEDFYVVRDERRSDTSRKEIACSAAPSFRTIIPQNSFHRNYGFRIVMYLI
ncbi:MAG: hypothetical protein RSB51_05150 [Clostridia bacterium]